LAHVAINFNGRSYRFACSENEVQRLEDIGKYVTAKLEELTREHGNIGDERLMLMAAIMAADELFDARSDIDELLEGGSEDAQSVSERRRAAAG
jgi:cell division protein ZapA